MLHDNRNPDCQLYATCSKHIKPKSIEGFAFGIGTTEAFLGLRKWKLTCTFAVFKIHYLYSFLFLTECLRIPFLFTLTASFIREKPVDEASFPNRIHLTLSTPSQVGSGSISQVSGEIMQKAHNARAKSLKTTFSNTLLSLRAIYK